MSLWAAVPHYVSQPPNPKATLALLNRLEDLIDLRIPLGELPEDARAWQLGVDQLAAEDSEVAEYVQTLEEARDTAELPEASGEAIAREFERYLRRRDGGPGQAPRRARTEGGDARICATPPAAAPGRRSRRVRSRSTGAGAEPGVGRAPSRRGDRGRSPVPRTSLGGLRHVDEERGRRRPGTAPLSVTSSAYALLGRGSRPGRTATASYSVSGVGSTSKRALGR